MRILTILKGYGYTSLQEFQREFNLSNAIIDLFRRDRRRLGRFMKEKVEPIKLPKGATHIDMNTGQCYKEGRFGFIFWWDKQCKTWDRCNRDNLKGLQKIQFYEYDQG